MISIVIFLLTAIVFSGAWMWKPFIATYLSVIFGCIISAVLIVSLLVERIERSNVPKSYFTALLAALLGIIFAAGVKMWLGA